MKNRCLIVEVILDRRKKAQKKVEREFRLAEEFKVFPFECSAVVRWDSGVAASANG